VNVLTIENLRKQFGMKVVYDDFDLQVQRGEVLALLGRSGVGKSVLLKLILGLLRPDRGRITFDGIVLTDLDEDRYVEVRRRVGMVFQASALFDSMTVAENVGYGLRENLRWPEDKIRARVRECLDLVDLPGVEELLPGALSGGMRKRVAIARAIAPAPQLLLYDEPTTGLDPSTARRVDALIVSLKERLGVTSLVVTHDMDSVDRVADRVTLVAAGRNAWTGGIDQVRSDPPAALRRFLYGEEEEEQWHPPAALP
jgi:phospholipid/cholesterol/gamma-HCH transport system ATP-binding protein